ncbi:MAG: membrane protein insertase YidC [Streptosporangiaceae bacterium]
MRLGILDPLYDIVAWLIMRIHAVLTTLHLGASSGTNWLLTIVVLVVLLRLLLLPLFVKQMHSQRKMLALAPQMQELRKRYKGDKQKLNEEMMKMYKENGANPLSGCLPLVAQLPVWYALLGVLEEITRWSNSQGTPEYGLTVTVVKSALHARIFGVSIADTFLHTPGTHVKVAVAITVVLSAVTTFLTVRQSMRRGMMQTPTVDASNPMAGMQKYMAYIAPLFALSGLYWQFGLVIYWLTSNVWTLGQQYFLFKSIPPLNVAAAAADAAAPTPTVKTTTLRSTTSTTARRTAASARTKPSATAARPSAGSTAKQSAGSAKQSAGTARQSAGTARQSAGTARQAAGTARQSADTARQAAGTARQAAGTAKQPAGTAKPSASTAKPSASPAKASAAAKKQSAAKTDAASLGIPPPTPNGSGGILRKFGKRAQPEPEPEPPEVTLVRQQRAKQSRSKRTGKR